MHGMPKSVTNRPVTMLLLCLGAAFAAEPEATRRTVFTFRPDAPVELAQGYSMTVGTATLPAEVRANPYTRFELEALVAGSDGETFGVRIEPRTRQGGKLEPMSGGLWGRRTTAEFATVTAEFRLAGEGIEDIGSFVVRCYRCEQKGTIRVRSLTIRCVQEPLLEPAALVAQAKARLTADGYTVGEQGGRLVAAKPDERRYYAIPEQPMPAARFETECGLGSTWLRRGFTPPLFPIGPYVYGTPEVCLKRAQEWGLPSLEAFFDRVAQDVAEHGGNTIYYANLTATPDTFKLAVEKARAHGVSVFGQLTANLYLRTTRGREHYDQVTVPTATAILPQYRDLAGVLGWMGCEESALEHIPMVQEYRALCRQLDPTHPLYTLHNHIGPARADNDHLPEWYGFDRYRFRCITDQGYVISTPREMVSLLRRELAEHYAEAARKGRPLIYVGQSYGEHVRLTRDDLAKQGLKGLSRRSGFREVEPGVWSGWPRYPPPRHGMYLQAWLAVAEGASGLLMYPYNSWVHGSTTIRSLVDETGREQPIWRELADCVKELKPLLPLCLTWHKEAVTDAETDTPWAFVRSFVQGFDRERFLVVVNTRIAEWDKDSPPRPGDETELHFNEHGLAGLRSVGPLAIRLRVQRPGALWDVLSGRPLAADADGAYALELLPGRGVVLLQGDEETLRAARTLLAGTANRG